MLILNPIKSTFKIRLIIVLAFLLICLSGCKNSAKIYNPGTYENNAEGYYSTLMVSVTVNAYQIEDITIVSHEEPEILSAIVFEELPPKIIKKNSIDVDGVSGATYTSKALLEAVDKALEEARRDLE